MSDVERILIGDRTKPLILTKRIVEDISPRWAPDIAYQFTSRAPCMVEHDFDTDSYTIIPLHDNKWWGFYFGKFGIYEPQLGFSFGNRNGEYWQLRIYLWKYTFIIGRTWNPPTRARADLPEIPESMLNR